MSDKSYCKRCGELDSCINDLCHSCAMALACDRFENEMEANADQVFPPPQHDKEGRQPELEAPPGWVVLPYNDAQNLTALQVQHIVEVCEHATDAGKCVVTTVAVGPNEGTRTIVDRPQGDVLFIITQAQNPMKGWTVIHGASSPTESREKP